MGYNVVVVGATGNVGHEMLNILAERQFPVDKIAALASRKSLGTEVTFGDETLTTQDLGRAGSEPASCGPLQQKEYYCESELFDRANGCRT